MGVQGSAGWTSPGGIVSFDAAATWQDFRNVSPQGDFGAFDGDRIPNRPWLFINAAARITAPQALVEGDTLSLAWYTRYVRAFFRGWESAGITASKQVIPTQVVHSAALTWAAPMPPFSISMAGEVDNLLDSNHYDVYGVQLPGRSVSVKATIILLNGVHFMLQIFPSSRCLVALCSLLCVACGSESLHAVANATDLVEPGEDTQVGIAIRVKNPDGKNIYLGVYDSVPTGTLDVATMVEFGDSDVAFYGGYAYVWNG